MRLNPLLPLMALLAGSWSMPVPAGPPADVMSIEVLPGWRTDRGTHMAGLRLTLAPGWKTYWRAPGDAGIAPQFDWSGSGNLGLAVLHWPVPEILHADAVPTLVYSGQVVLPVEITPVAEDGDIRLAGRIDLGVCEDICVPMTVEFAADLTDAGKPDPAIAAALADRPMTPAEAGVAEARCHAAPTAEGLALRAELHMPPDEGRQVVVIEPGRAGIWVSSAKTEWRDGWLTAEVEMIAADGGPVGLDRSDLRITVVGSSGAVDIRGCAAP